MSMKDRQNNSLFTNASTKLQNEVDVVAGWWCLLLEFHQNSRGLREIHKAKETLLRWRATNGRLQSRTSKASNVRNCENMRALKMDYFRNWKKLLEDSKRLWFSGSKFTMVKSCCLTVSGRTRNRHQNFTRDNNAWSRLGTRSVVPSSRKQYKVAALHSKAW